MRAVHWVVYGSDTLRTTPAMSVKAKNERVRKAKPRRRPVVRGAPRRTRLDTDVRRSQLLEFGKRMFATRAYEDISIDEVAATAGVSKGLLFHYFQNKRGFYVETIRALSLERRRATEPDASLPPWERLRAALDAHLIHAKRDGAMYVAFCGSGAAISPEVPRILEEHREAMMHYLLENLGVPKASPLLRAGLRAWMFMVEGVCLEWIANPSLKQEQLRELLISGYRALLQRTLELEPKSADMVNAMVKQTHQHETKIAAGRS
jgi:AcrR family transcriptional regulator